MIPKGKTGNGGSRVNEENPSVAERSSNSYSIDRHLAERSPDSSRERKCSCVERSTGHCKCEANRHEGFSGFRKTPSPVPSGGDRGTIGPQCSTLDPVRSGDHRSRRDHTSERDSERWTDRPSSDREDSLVIDESVPCDREHTHDERTLDQVGGDRALCRTKLLPVTRLGGHIDVNC